MSKPDPYLQRCAAKLAPVLTRQAALHALRNIKRHFVEEARREMRINEVEPALRRAAEAETKVATLIPRTDPYGLGRAVEVMQTKVAGLEARLQRLAASRRRWVKRWCDAEREAREQRALAEESNRQLCHVDVTELRCPGPAAGLPGCGKCKACLELELAALKDAADPMCDCDEGCEHRRSGHQAATGKPLFYIQDRRTSVGNCASWWRPSGGGYTCELGEAGRYTAEEVKRRGLDGDHKPWPCEVVDKLAVTHVRVEHLRSALEASHG